MTDEPKVGTDDTDTDTEETTVPADAAPARRPSPSAQAASRARRIGGRPTPGPRRSPSGPVADAQTGIKTAPNKKAALTKRPKPAAAPADDSASSTRRGGLRAARAAATERTAGAAVAERPATSLRKRLTPKPTRSSTADGAAARRRTELIQWVPAGVLGVAVVVLAVLCYTFGTGVWHGAKSAGEVRTQVLAAAKTCTAKVSSYDYRKLAQSKKDGQSCATGQFKKDYTTAMDTIIAKEAPKTQTTQSVNVAKAGIEQVSSDGKQWTLLIYGQHTVTNKTTGLKTPRLDKLSVRVTMDKVGDKWLISKLNLVDG
jgi:Mce-associated membrane protein